VREKEGLTYGIYGRAEGVGMHEQGYWRIFTFFAPKDVVKGITSTLREIQAIHEHGITDNELKRFKAILNTRYALIEDSLFKKVQDAHARAVAGVSDAMYTEFRNALQAMRPSDVHEAMQTYLRPDTLVISGSGPIHGVKNNIQAFGV
jgi:predicted Zn-dependent peptidase